MFNSVQPKNLPGLDSVRTQVPTSELISGLTHTLNVVQDELPDVVLPVEGEQLQLEDIMVLKWRMALETRMQREN